MDVADAREVEVGAGGAVHGAQAECEKRYREFEVFHKHRIASKMRDIVSQSTRKTMLWDTFATVYLGGLPVWHQVPITTILKVNRAAITHTTGATSRARPVSSLSTA
ncbi:hypothetical protein MasN3_27850 [Massilia varians]|uniref:Uncharacterized protein n=1 Tax=Massilia varians TaxID=457921 RepID=A0ABM8C7R4_9BURK|nr:hypothetical protein MasN3_27850 [Massilia varians]